MTIGHPHDHWYRTERGTLRGYRHAHIVNRRGHVRGTIWMGPYPYAYRYAP